MGSPACAWPWRRANRWRRASWWRSRRMPDGFDLSGRVAIVTGGAGLLGQQHARAIAGAGGIPVLLDVSERAEEAGQELGGWGRQTDITSHRDLEECLKELLERYGRVDILINNAANNPKMENRSDVNFS